ncbi:hypothetical protein F5Y17DRAFT_184619 [Xylariaceae sp. FL0594]|nr:hypothetical protein F5Y17DRAFT_184619 [Xylariaceae sp. FL0594]
MAEASLLANRLGSPTAEPGPINTGSLHRQLCGLLPQVKQGHVYRHATTHATAPSLLNLPPIMDEGGHEQPVPKAPTAPTAPTAPKTSFQDLPYDPLRLIWERLSVNDALSFRRICRHITKELRDDFCKEFFSHRRFSITYHSLQALIDLSKEGGLQGHVTHLTIGLDRFSSINAIPRVLPIQRILDNPALPGPVEPQVKAGVADIYKFEALGAEQSFLVNSGHFLLMLSEALGNLTKLEHFSLQDHPVPRGLQRPGMHPFLLSYGWSHVLRETGIDLTSVELSLDAKDDRFVDLVFSASLFALAQTRKQITELTVDIQRDTIGLSSSAFCLPAYFRPVVSPMLSKLQSLELSVSFAQVATDSYTTPQNIFLIWQEHHLFAFLRHTPDLRTLRIRSQNRGVYDAGVIEWLAKLLRSEGHDEPGVGDHYYKKTLLASDPRSTVFPGDPETLMLPGYKTYFENLVDLDLTNMITSPGILLAVLWSLSRSLKRLTFRKIGLQIGSFNHVAWPDPWLDPPPPAKPKPDDKPDDKPPGPNGWSTFFLGMRGSLPVLEQLTLSSLQYQAAECLATKERPQDIFLNPNQGSHHVLFLPSPIGDQLRLRSELIYA